jgi:hypothetical protein
LLGAAFLRADVPWALTAWLPVFLDAVADEAEDGLQLLMTLERTWFAARSKVAGQRRTSRAGIAIDIMAAAARFGDLARQGARDGGEEHGGTARPILPRGRRRRGEPPPR